MMNALQNDDNNITSNNCLNLNKVIGDLSLLIMLNQVFTAKELCTHTIDEIKKNRDFDEKIAGLFNDENTIQA